MVKVYMSAYQILAWIEKQIPETTTDEGFEILTELKWNITHKKKKE